MVRNDWTAPVLLFAALVVCMAAGCGGGDEGELPSASTDEIAQFIEENPEFAAPPASSSGSSELGLER